MELLLNIYPITWDVEDCLKNKGQSFPPKLILAAAFGGLTINVNRAKKYVLQLEPFLSIYSWVLYA